MNRPLPSWPEFSTHNQVMVFQDAVIEQKKDYLSQNKKGHLLESFTLDSPIPFSLEKVLKKIKDLNEEMKEGARGLKHIFKKKVHPF